MNSAPDVLLFTECNGAPGWGRDAGCYAIASRLRQEGFRVQVIDFFSFFDPRFMQEAIMRFVGDQTLVVGFSSTHFSKFLPKDFRRYMVEAERTERNEAWNTYFPFDAELMEGFFAAIKAKSPQVKIVVGGQKVVQKRKLQELHPGVDIWIEGMADVSIVQICRKLARDRTWTKPRVRSEDEHPAISDFATAKMIWRDSDGIFPGEALPLEIARGCPFHCAFCDYMKKKKGEWIKDPQALRDALIENFEKYSIVHYMITDFLVNEDIRKMEMVWKVFTSLPFKIEWSGFARLDLLKAWPEMREMIYESGARSVMWGIESLNRDTGKLIGKNCDLDQITALLEYCKKLWRDEIVVGSGFIVGLPGETKESILQMMDWILGASPLLHGFEITPLFIGDYNPDKASRIAFSEIQTHPQKFGYRIALREKGGTFFEDWINPSLGLSKSECIEIIERYQAIPRWGERKILATYHNYSRLKNLGFSHQELLESLPANAQFIEKAERNYRSMASSYLAKVFR